MLGYEKKRAETIHKEAVFFFLNLSEQGGRAAHGAGTLCLARAPRPWRGRATIAVSCSDFLALFWCFGAGAPFMGGETPFHQNVFLSSFFFFFFFFFPNENSKKRAWVASHEALF